MNPARSTAVIQPGMGGRITMTVTFVLFAWLLTACGLSASEVRPAGGSLVAEGGNFKLPAELSRVNVTSGKFAEYMGRETGCPLATVANFLAADARRDITSVRVAPLSVAGGGNEKEAGDYLGTSRDVTALPSTDGGKAAAGQEPSARVIDGTIADCQVTSGVHVYSDDFIGHTREYLQTRK